MSDLVPTRTVRQAKAREKRILDGVAEIQPFIQDRDWELLGYQSFVEWSDAKLFPMLDALDATVKRELQPELHRALRAPDPVTKRQLTTREIAGRTGAARNTVEKDLRSTVAQPEPDTILDAEIVDEPTDHRPMVTVLKEWKAEHAHDEPDPDAVEYGPDEFIQNQVAHMLRSIQRLSAHLFDPYEEHESRAAVITDRTKAEVNAGLVTAKNLLGKIKKELS